jgi:hypothetical protein
MYIKIKVKKDIYDRKCEIYDTIVFIDKISSITYTKKGVLMITMNIPDQVFFPDCSFDEIEQRILAAIEGRDYDERARRKIDLVSENQKAS